MIINQYNLTRNTTVTERRPGLIECMVELFDASVHNNRLQVCDAFLQTYESVNVTAAAGSRGTHSEEIFAVGAYLI